jgi:hypothetical protein
MMRSRGRFETSGRRTLMIATALLLAALASSAPALADSVGSPRSASGIQHPDRHAPRHSFGRGTSTNWSGYAVAGTAASDVIGTWTQPTVTCSAGENSWSSPWVGIDGDTSNTVEQIGTDSDCRNGSPVYYAWYEMYPKSLVTVPMTARPGDSFTGEVSYSPSGAFILKLTDNTTRASYQTSQSSKKPQRASVEWIIEGPSSGLLSTFGSVLFSGASATINNRTGNLGSFANLDAITMVTNQGVVRAVPSAVTKGTSFAVSWQHA